MRRPLVHGLLLAGFAAAAQPAALAGPLDRQSGDYEYRTNPAVDDMLRVPGVIGMAYQDAMQVMQQAGLNPRMKKITQADKRYDGQEGLVVAQTPLPGGVAMIGSSVTVICYMPPAQERPQASPGSGTGAPAAGEAGSDDSSNPATPGASGGSGYAPPSWQADKDKQQDLPPPPRRKPGSDQPDSTAAGRGNSR